MAVTLSFLIASLHLAFIAFVVLGGLMVLRWPRLAWAHIPCVAWGAYVEFSGTVCPLTPLENHYRRLAGQQGYDTSFTEQYLLPLIYPEILFERPLPDGFFTGLGVFVIALNGVLYARLILQRKKPSE